MSSHATSPSPHPSPTPTTPPRLRWIDTSRAVAVILVVLFHVTIGHYYLMAWVGGLETGRWARINQILSIIRMPLLFALSGVLASGKIHRGFRRGKAILGAATNYWLYTIWLITYGIFILCMPPDFPTPHKVASLDQWLIQLWLPNTYLWYLFALSTYILLFTALRRVPPWITLTALFILHLIAVQAWSLESALWTRAFTYAIFFGLGVHGRAILTRMASSPPLTILTAITSWAIYQPIGMTRLLSLAPPGPGYATLIALLYITLGLTAVGFVGCLVRIPHLATPLTYLGHHTLGIYTLHIPLATILNLITLGLSTGLGSTIRSIPCAVFLYPILATTIVIAGCVLLEKILRRIPTLAFLFTLPKPLAKACEHLRTTLNNTTPTRK
ncbi:acyltransferase family protein, partial [Dermatophilus congolensis]|nr:acyltransferase family protein [Dermatophilus congolensis]